MNALIAAVGAQHFDRAFARAAARPRTARR
jgi:hypothetical protein